MHLQTLFKLLRSPRKAFIVLGSKHLLNWIPDSLYLRIAYYCEMGSILHLKAPVNYTEKIQWVKLYDRRPEYNTYVDKYEVRDYIKQRIGADYLIPLIDVYDHPDNIDWSSLPNRFVLKCTHGSSMNIICTDKEQLDEAQTKLQLSHWMHVNLFWLGREWAYKDVKPRIICEAFISDNTQTPHDYKVICFNGKPHLIEIHTDRFGEHTLDFYSLDWRHMDYVDGYPSCHHNIEKPPVLDEMLRLSEQLATGTCISRIDWYYVSGKLFFGEITLYEASGFPRAYKSDANLYLGNQIQLPQ